MGCDWLSEIGRQKIVKNTVFIEHCVAKVERAQVRTIGWALIET